MLQKTLINGIDVSAYVISSEYERTYGDMISQVDVKIVQTVNDVLTIEAGQTLEIWRGWTTSTDEKIFDGYVQAFDIDKGIVKIIGKDKLWDLVRKEVTHVYNSADAFSGKISAIFHDLVETYGLLTCTAQDSGTTIIMDKFVCNHTDIFERCKKLADILDWQFYYRADTDTVYFEPKGFTTNSTVLTVGSNIYELPKWTYDNTQMINDLTVVGAYQEIETTESGQIGHTTGYTTADVLLSFTPISVKVYNDNNNPPTTLKIGGMPDSTATYDYWVDKENKKLMPFTTFADDSRLEVRYSHAVPIPIHMWNQSSIDAYGQFKTTITLTDIRNIADAENRGSNYLSKYSTPFVYSTVKVKNDSTYGLAVGQNIRVIDNISKPNIDETMTITRLRIRYPADYDELDIGDKMWRLETWQASVEERFKRMSEDELANQDIITELVDINNLPVPLQLVPRYRKLLTQTVSGTNIFILGHSAYGILGTSKLGATNMGAETDNYIQQYENNYEETFLDTDFKDAVTDANWDTTNKVLDFT
jgi:hypothetical protein